MQLHAHVEQFRSGDRTLPGPDAARGRDPNGLGRRLRGQRQPPSLLTDTDNFDDNSTIGPKCTESPSSWTSGRISSASCTVPLGRRVGPHLVPLPLRAPIGPGRLSRRSRTHPFSRFFFPPSQRSVVKLIDHAQSWSNSRSSFSDRHRPLSPRYMLQTLFCCVGYDRVTGRHLMELTNNDVSGAVSLDPIPK